MKAILHFKRLLAIVLCASICTAAIAQKPTKPRTTAYKFNPKLVKTFLGKFTGKDGTATVEDAKQAIASSLSIIDDKKNIYKLSSYEFAYTKWGTAQDETTGVTSKQSTMSADRFTETPLPDIWLSNINETLHSGEELYFYDIIAFDNKGGRFFAPEIKIVIQ